MKKGAADRKTCVSVKAFAYVHRQKMSERAGLQYLKQPGEYWVYDTPGLPKPKKSEFAFEKPRVSRILAWKGARYPRVSEYEIILSHEKHEKK